MKGLFVGENKIILYYLIMMLPIVLLTRPEASYSLVMRIGYFMLLVIPLLQNPQFTPFVILAFFGFSDNACYSFLPESYWIRYALVIGLLLLSRRYYKMDVSLLSKYYVFYLYVLLVSMFYGDIDHPVIQNALLALLLAPFITNEKDISRVAIGFCLMSVALSLSFYLNFAYFVVEYGIGKEFEMGSWKNPNSLGAAIGCAIPMIVAMSVDVIIIRKNMLSKIALIASGIVCFMTLLSLGSRGAFMAVVASSLLLLMFSSNLKRNQKVGLVIIVTFVVIALYYWNVFDLVVYRFTQLESLGSTEELGGRAETWKIKLEAFACVDSWRQLFGMGIGNTISLGIFKSTHNDFLTSLIAFGIIGLMLFLIFLFSPIVRGGVKEKKPILFLLLFVVMESMVVEPLFRGYFHFWLFMIVLYKMSHLRARSRKISGRFRWGL